MTTDSDLDAILQVDDSKAERKFRSRKAKALASINKKLRQKKRDWKDVCKHNRTVALACSKSHRRRTAVKEALLEIELDELYQQKERIIKARRR